MSKNFTQKVVRCAMLYFKVIRTLCPCWIIIDFTFYHFTVITFALGDMWGVPDFLFPIVHFPKWKDRRNFGVDEIKTTKTALSMSHRRPLIINSDKRPWSHIVSFDWWRWPSVHVSPGLRLPLPFWLPSRRTVQSCSIGLPSRPCWLRPSYAVPCWYRPLSYRNNSNNKKIILIIADTPYHTV